MHPKSKNRHTKASYYDPPHPAMDTGTEPAASGEQVTRLITYALASLTLSLYARIPLYAAAVLVLVAWGMGGVIGDAPPKYVDLNQMTNAEIDKLVLKQL
jgi:hypothetical protein